MFVVGSDLVLGNATGTPLGLARGPKGNRTQRGAVAQVVAGHSRILKGFHTVAQGWTAPAGLPWDWGSDPVNPGGVAPFGIRPAESDASPAGLGDPCG